MSKETKDKIKQAFADLVAEKPLSKIGIRDIAEASGINRNTFYYYYKNIPGLIESLVKESVDAIIAEYPPTYDTLEECFTAAMDFAKEQRQMIYNIYNSTNRSVFERYLWKICDYIVNAYLNSLPPLSPREIPPRPEEMAIIRDMLKYELFGFIVDWINHGMPEEAADKIWILSNFLQSRLILHP